MKLWKKNETKHPSSRKQYSKRMFIDVVRFSCFFFDHKKLFTAAFHIRVVTFPSAYRFFYMYQPTTKEEGKQTFFSFSFLVLLSIFFPYICDIPSDLGSILLFGLFFVFFALIYWAPVTFS